MVLFPRNHTVIRVLPGGYVDGSWTPAVESAPIPYVLDVQPATGEDIEQIRSQTGGQQLSGMLRVFGGTANPLHEGDILLFDNARWICVSAPPARDILGPETAHVRYLFTREIAPG